MNRNKLQESREPKKNDDDKTQYRIKIHFQYKLIQSDGQLPKHQWEHNKRKARGVYPVPFDQFFGIEIKKARINNSLYDPYQYNHAEINQKPKNLNRHYKCFVILELIGFVIEK